MKKLIILSISLVFLNCKGNTQKQNKETFKVTKTEAEWKAQLSELEFYVLRKAGTEPPFSSPLNKNNKIVATVLS